MTSQKIFFVCFFLFLELLVLVPVKLAWQAVAVFVPNTCRVDHLMIAFCAIYGCLLLWTHYKNMRATHDETAKTSAWQFQMVLFHMTTIIAFVSPYAITINLPPPNTNPVSDWLLLVVIVASLGNMVSSFVGGARGQDLWVEDMKSQGKKVTGHIAPMGGGFYTVDE